MRGLAFAITAGVAFSAAFFVNDRRLAALRAEIADLQQGLLDGNKDLGGL